jgi:hypothetical protein
MSVIWDLVKVESRLESVQEGLFHEALLRLIRLKGVASNLGRGNMLDFYCPWALAGIPGTTTSQACLRFVKGSVLKILRQNDNSCGQKIFRHLILRSEASTRRSIY